VRIVCQRVKRAKVEIGGQLFSEIKLGFLLLIGLEKDDTREDALKLACKISQLRIFSDQNEKMNLNCASVEGEILCVSQFTLCASLKKGTRPSFEKAMEPNKARELFDYFVEILKLHFPVKTGAFGVNMNIESINMGPVTILMDSKQ